jgi:hypothetical protein
MTDPKKTEDGPAQIRRGGASGPKVNLRKGIQGFVLVAFLIFFFIGPPSLDRRVFIFGTIVVVVLIDLFMLWRGDLDYTHWESRTWSFRLNLGMLALAVVLFGYALTDRF